MRPDFDELVGDIAPEDRERLLRAHELLLAAGPPPELPPALEQPPERPKRSEIAYFPRRRWAAAALAAAAIAALAFGGGYLIGNSGGGGSFATHAVVKMRGTAAAPTGAEASLQLGNRDEAGNWPMIVNVSNLRTLAKGGYYNLYLTKRGRPVVLCGSFIYRSPRESVHFTEPYQLAHFDGWVVTEQPPRHHEPGRIVLTSERI
jgi:hypothetical protein